MYCMKCGKENADNSRFCTACGTKLTIAPEEKAETIEIKKVKKDTVKPVKPKNKSKLGIILAVTVLLVVAVGCILKFSDRDKGYEQTISRFFVAAENNDEYSMMACFPDPVTRTYPLYDMKQNLKDATRGITNDVGSGWEIGYEITEVKSLGKGICRSLEENYRDRFLITNLKIDKVKKVKLNIWVKRILGIHLKAEDEFFDQIPDMAPVELYVIKVGNNWYMDIDSYKAPLDRLYSLGKYYSGLTLK